MSIIKLQAEGLNLADTFAFSGTVSGAGETNKPYFEAYTSGLQQTNHNTTTKLTFGSEEHDTNNNFAHTLHIHGQYITNT